MLLRYPPFFLTACTRAAAGDVYPKEGRPCSRSGVRDRECAVSRKTAFFAQRAREKTVAPFLNGTGPVFVR